MSRTTVNVTGDAAGSMFVAKSINISEPAQSQFCQKEVQVIPKQEEKEPSPLNSDY